MNDIVLIVKYSFGPEVLTVEESKLSIDFFVFVSLFNQRILMII